MTKDLPVNYKLDRSTFWYVGQSNAVYAALFGFTKTFLSTGSREMKMK